jgi:starch-binding outer membrane protein, SusD/RagB family
MTTRIDRDLPRNAVTSRTVARGAAVGTLALALAACTADRLVVPNYNNPTTESVSGDPVAAIPLLANGVLRNDRDAATGYVLGVGILGRETYNYTPTEGRNTTGWLTSDVNNSTSFGGGALWGAYYTELRNIANLIATANSAPENVLPAARKSATLGFAHTMEALALSYIISTRHTLGAPVAVDPDPTVISPFVSRDSAYGYIAARLELAKTELNAGGTAFPFTLHEGFAGFTTPATFLRFNRAIAARVNAYRASLGTSGCGAALSAACYNTVLTNLGESFIDPAGSLTAGPFRPFSATANDVANGISNAASANVLLHAKSDSGIPTKANGARDDRFTAKVTTIARRNPPNAQIGVSTTFDFAGYVDRSSPVPIIRNEELLLLRAEARYFTGNTAGALEDINTVRTRSGGLAPLTTLGTQAQFLDELLTNRRLSLLFEGHRWVDMRRFGRLAQLTLDLPTHIVATQLPVPQAECLSRVVSPNKAPGC